MDRSASAFAFVSGRPRLRALASSEADLLAVRARLEDAIGPVPQADVVEPFDPSDPTEPWELRVDLPGADPALAALLDGPADFRWSVTDSPGLTEALDRGWLVAEELDPDGLRARELTDPDRTRRPDLERPDAADPLRDAFPGRDAGPVLHRPTGRWGVEVRGEDEDALLPELRAVLRADPRFAPDPEGERILGGLVVRLWAVGPLAAGLPGDRPSDDALAWLDDAAVLHEDVEVQVVPRSPRDHDRVVDAVAEVARAAGWHGGRPRWVAGAFSPAWRAAPDVVRAHLAAVRTAPGVAAVRVVPGEPSGLAERWPAIDPAWRVVGGRCLVRLADPVPDRDRLERADDRVPDARDHAAADAVPFDVRPIVDRRGRRGLEVQGGRRALGEDGLAELLLGAAEARHPDLLRVGTFGFVRDGARVHLWYRDPVEPGPREWRGR